MTTTPSGKRGSALWALLFYGFIRPIGRVMRWLRLGSFRGATDPKAATYWVARRK